MQVSITWLKDYIDFEETPEELANKLTMAGVPVENVIRADEGLDKVVTGRIERITKHPDSDHLQICTMNVGTAETLQIVTGAPNVAEGQVVPVAMLGAHLPNGLKISKSKLRGVVSMGMLCSAGELKLDIENLPEEQQTGIYILPMDTPIGLSAKEVLGLDDVVLEFELTANRGDCFSVFGLVREVAVLTGNTPHWPEIEVKEDVPAEAASFIKIGIADEDLCARFSARILKNVKIGPSPEWMQKRLNGAGIRAINNVVDVTNFVMIELGQPMHAYDYDEISGQSLTVRRAVQGEELHTLDDSSRRAKGGELVVADAEKAAGLAGVMGGLETEITGKTTMVVLESASFNGPSIRRTSRACGLHSEASGRFERGVDVKETQRALNRAAQLLQNMGACNVCKGILDVYPHPADQVKVIFSVEQINRRLGTELSGNQMTEILQSLGFEMEELADGRYLVRVPSWRNDVTCMEDLSEEIARIYGFDNIHATLMGGKVMQGGQSAEQDFIDNIKNALSSLGMSEELSFSFTHPSMFDKLNIPADSQLRQAIPIMNPLTDEYPLVRTTLLSSIFENTIRNFSRKNEDVRLFEVAPVFFPKALPVTEQPDEVLKLAGLITGRRALVGWNQDKEYVDFFDIKGIVEELLVQLKISNYTVEAGEHYAMHPGKTAIFKKGRETIATLGEVHPAVADNLGITKKMYIFEMDVATLMKYTATHFTYTQLPKYPAISRDLAILVDEAVSAADIEKTIAKNAGKYFKEISLFDVYTGKQIENGKKSLAFTMQFQAADKTLTDEQADVAFQSILQAVEKEYNAVLRA